MGNTYYLKTDEKVLDSWKVLILLFFFFFFSPKFIEIKTYIRFGYIFLLLVFVFHLLSYRA